MSKQKNKLITIIIALIVTLCITIPATLALLGDSVHVFENDILTYYINITYDGKDETGVSSGDGTTVNIYSGYIEVEDKLPEDLTFDSFVRNSTEEIGAVNRTDGSPCTGYVVDGLDGLVYDEETHTIKFTVNNLQAGCILTVGVNTRTPILEDGQDRMDFYNTAVATEGLTIKSSNTVHAWIGKESTENDSKYTVTYEFEGDVPTNVTSLPTQKKFIENSVVSIESDAVAPGYIFSGWRIVEEDVTVTENKFSMPAHNVTLVGSFTKDESFVPYKVTYQIVGYNNPDNFSTPKEKEYYPKENVYMDTLKAGDVYNDYRFSGWQTANENIEIIDGQFVMPSEDVLFIGSWELVEYKVEYQFMGAIIPPNSEDLLPETQTYRPGAQVTLEGITNPEGYVFLGWYHNNTFEMPAEDIVIYGEWKYAVQYFQPSITKNIIDKKEYYSFGETVTYDIVVTAPNSTSLRDIYVKESKEGAKFIAGDGYELITDTIVRIPTLEAGASIALKSEYVASVADNGEVVNEVEIIGAISDDNYEIDRSEKYTATDTFYIDSRLKVCNNVENGLNDAILQYHIRGYGYDSWIVLEENTCKNIYLTPGEYIIEEVIPQEYELTKVSGVITSNNSSFTVEKGQEYQAIFDHNYEKKGFFHFFGRIENIIKNR